MGTSSAATIRWRTNVPAIGRVTFGLSATSLTGVVSEPTSTTEHEVRLTGLLTDQQYFYSVGTTSGILEQGINNYFWTAPSLTTKRKIRIASFGDVGTNINTNQAYVRDAFLNFRSNTPTDLWMLIGDNSYDGADSQYQTNFFDPFKSSLLKNCMLFPVPGNHDYQDYVRYPTAPDRRVERDIDYYAMFSLPTNAETGGIPSQSEQYYSFDYGPVHFVMLDSYGKNPVQVNSTSPIVPKAFYEDTITVGYTIPNEQIAWLKQDLAATSQKWKIVYFHHPPYTRGTHDSESESELIDIRMKINPILERFGVDMVVTGHSHVYERSYPLHDHRGAMSEFAMNPSAFRFPEDNGSGRYDGSSSSCPYKNTSEKKKQGTVYVVSGSSGALEPQKPDLGIHSAMVPGTTQKLIGGSFFMEVEDNRLDAKFLLNVANSPGSYTITDQFTMMKDVDKTQSFTITNGQSVTLSASFISDYAWSSPTSTTFAASTPSVVVTPATSTTYVVRDSKNCLLDTYVVQVTGNGAMFTVKVGNWNDPTVWSGNRIPVSTDLIQIRHNVAIPASIQARALQVQFNPGVSLSYGLGAQLLLSQ
ncbi:metallophosphoesterase family protein [Spirosoma spitsbergense]|uniref:metallophosphoesterase family protein n=1 Tax=Spirosoma spitsbergense TaxID=431554 RepID=UPI003CCB888E